MKKRCLLVGVWFFVSVLLTAPVLAQEVPSLFDVAGEWSKVVIEGYSLNDKGLCVAINENMTATVEIPVIQEWGGSLANFTLFSERKVKVKTGPNVKQWKLITIKDQVGKGSFSLPPIGNNIYINIEVSYDAFSGNLFYFGSEMEGQAGREDGEGVEFKGQQYWVRTGYATVKVIFIR